MRGSHQFMGEPRARVGSRAQPLSPWQRPSASPAHTGGLVTTWLSATPGLLEPPGQSLVRGESRAREERDNTICPGLAAWHPGVHLSPFFQSQPFRPWGQTLSPPSSPWWLRPSWWSALSVLSLQQRPRWTLQVLWCR